MIEPKSSATILALADLAELSAKQLEDGQSIDDVIALLRNASKAVRSVLEPIQDDEDDAEIDADEEMALAEVDNTLREIENVSA